MSYRAKSILTALAFVAIAAVALGLLYTLALGALFVNFAAYIADRPALLGVSVGGIAGVAIAIIELLLSLWRDLKEEDAREQRLKVLLELPTGVGKTEQKLREATKMDEDLFNKRLYELVLAGRVRVETGGDGKRRYTLT